MPTTDDLIAERYRLQRIVGRGGMGEVWMAADVLLGRQVAAKRIGARDASERDLARARQEARVTAMLDHEHVVRVFDLVVEDGEQWLVMELVESEDLARLVRRTGALDTATAARLVLQTAQALAAAHAAGIVHRDVKPSNLLVTPSWHVKLGDFGIARLEGDVGTTRTGQLVGSPGYLAPEVGIGRPATAASDMWSLGATLFHALDGEAPYRTEDGNLMATLYRIVNEPPPPLQRGEWLTPVVSSLMVHEPEQRWTAPQVVAYVEDALARTTPARRPPAPGPRTAQPIRPTQAVPAPQPTQPVQPVPLATAGHPVAADGATSTMPALPPRAPAPTAPVLPPVTRSGAPRSPGSARRPASRSWPLVAAAAVVLLLLLAGGIGLAQRGGSDDDTAGGQGSPSASASASPTAATSAGIQAFIRDYLSTAPADPQRGFQRLTPAFQRESKGLAGYRGFWGTIASATPTRIDADPGALTVDYDVDYRHDDGSTSTDVVRLRLTMSNGRYLISGEES